MLTRLKRIVAWILIVFGALLALATFIPTEGAQAEEGAKVVMFLGFLTIFIGIMLFRVGVKRHHAPTLPVKDGKPAPYTTKQCPECGERIALDAETCPECEKKQKPDASTCGGKGAEEKGYFARERSNAKKAGCTHYYWRAGQSDPCERCANNDGHKFAYDEELSGGHAGARAGCRCYPEAIIPKD